MRGDINLLPKKRSSDKTKLATGFIVFIIVIIAISVFVFVYMPNMEKRSVKKEIEAKQAELDEQTATQGEYSKLLGELKALKKRNMIFENISNTNLSISGILEDIETAIPTSIVLEEITYSSGFLNIKGTTPSSVPLSQFMVNLRNLDEVLAVSLASMELESNEYEGISSELYIFDLSLFYYEEIDENLESQEETEDINAEEEGAIEETVAEDTTTDEGAQ